MLMRLRDEQKQQFEIARKVIQEYYKGKQATRSGVPYINHIDEGLKVLDEGIIDHDYEYLPYAYISYMLHPIYQTEEEPEWIIRNICAELNMSLPVEAMMMFTKYGLEYKKLANSYLSGDHTIGATLDPKILQIYYRETILALLADKIQNKKDFLKYHLGTHPKSDILEDYFNVWLKCLLSEVDPGEDELISIING